MRHRELWKLIVESLEEYKSLLITPPPTGTTRPSAEDYIADQINSQYEISADESSFARECFLGVLRYEKVCEGILQGFCDALKRNKQDRYTMYLIAYLFVYRFAEVSGRFLRSLMDKSTSTTRLAEYVGYLLDESKMTQYATPVLRQSYDDEYIRRFVIGNIQKHHAEADRDVLQFYVSRATNPIQASQSIAAHSDDEDDEESRLPTAHQSVAGGGGKSVGGASATSPSRRSVASMRSSKAPTVAKAPNISQGGTSRRDLALRQVPPAHVREMLATVASPKPPAIEVPEDGIIPLDGPRRQRDPLANPRADEGFVETERPMHRDRLLAEKKAREDAQFEADPVMRDRLQPEDVREKFSKLQSSAPSVKHTTASIRREELLYRRRDQRRDQELLRKAQEMRDDSEYQEWRQKQEDDARIERETRISERKLEMMLADEEARMAKVRQEQQNLASAADFRRTMTAWREAAATEDAAEAARKTKFAAQLRQEVQELTEAATRQVKNEKKASAVQVKTESQQNEMKAAATLELERQRKSALIAEIRTLQEQTLLLRPQAIEQAREARLKELGVMDTMSIDELRSKLCDVRNEHEELEQSRRLNFQNHRTNQRRELDTMLSRCQMERNLYLDQKSKERDERREQAATQASQQRAVEEVRLLELHEKLSKARQARKEVNDKRKEEERQRKVEAMLLAGDAGAMEAKKWAEMERGVNNRVLREQNASVRELKTDRTKLRMLSQQRESNIKLETVKHASARAQSDHKLTTKRALAEEDRAFDDNFKLAAIDAMRKERAAMRTRTA